MKLISTVLTLGAILVLEPVYAQDMHHTATTNKPDEHHRVVHHTVRHRVSYRRNSKTFQEEHQQTEDLNRQYREMGSQAH